MFVPLKLKEIKFCIDITSAGLYLVPRYEINSSQEEIKCSKVHFRINFVYGL
jgi:hypothetical protein